MPSFRMDGREVEFEKGESIIQVAERLKTDIPHYCWHPKLSVAANCRMCLVEVEKQPKLLPACQTPVAEGMVVHTASEKVKAAQAAVHEFELINHPLDCPICDQAGECRLQDYFMKHQLRPSRMRDEKQHKPRLEKLGPHVMYNGERCVMCTRCVRFMAEVPQNPQLGIFNRGDHAEIGCAPGVTLDDPYSLNVVDVCPVGALTSTVFRFKQRSWNLTRSESICGGCARGCNTNVDQRSGVVYRLLPRQNDEVNSAWMCDEGRLTYARANDDRLTRAMGKGGAALTAQAALQRAVELLKPVAEAKKGLAVALSLHATVEEAYVVGRLAKDVLGAEVVAVMGYANGAGDRLLRVVDRNPNRAGVMRVLAELGIQAMDGAGLVQAIQAGRIKALLAVGHESSELAALAHAAQKLEVVVHVANKRTQLAEAAHVTLPSLSSVQTDGIWVNVQNRAQRLVPAFGPEVDARPAHQWLLELASRMGVAFALPSVQSIRAEVQAQLPSFKHARLTEVGPMGSPLGWS